MSDRTSAPFCAQHLKDPACGGRAVKTTECAHAVALCATCVCWACAYAPLTEKDMGRVGRDELMGRLVHAQREAARLQKDHDAMLATCASAQARGTQLVDEVRGLRSVLGVRASITAAPDQLLSVIVDLAAEHYRAECKHGKVERFVGTPDGTGAGSFVKAAEAAKEECERARAAGTLTWGHILVEEVFEALAEGDAPSLRAELLQVACVAAMWIEVIDLRKAQP